MPKGAGKKQKVQAPPLIFLDKVAYLVLAVLVCAAAFSSVILFGFLQRAVVLRATDVIAYEDTAAALWLLLPVFPAFLAGIVLLYMAYTERKPIFGGRPPKPAATKKKRRFPIATTVIALTLLWLLLWIPAIGGLYSRTEITETEVRRYASFGRQIETISLSEASSVTVGVYRGKNRGFGGWRLSYRIDFAGGRHYTFSSAPDTILRLDGLFSGIPKSAEGTENFEKYCKANGCTDAQREALKEILLLR